MTFCPPFNDVMIPKHLLRGIRCLLIVNLYKLDVMGILGSKDEIFQLSCHTGAFCDLGKVKFPYTTCGYNDSNSFLTAEGCARVYLLCVVG